MPEPIVVVEDLHKTFVHMGRSLEVLRGIDLSIDQGEVLAIVGSSGAGKSTLLHCIGTLDIPTRGRIRLGRDDLTGLSGAKLASIRNRMIGFVFQFHHLLPEFNALENVMMPGLIQGMSHAEVQGAARALLEEVGLGKRATHRPGELSGGEQQRVALARALVIRPRCLLLDEPLSNLDAKLRLEMRAEIRRVCKEFNLTTVYVTHDQKEALSISDRMAILENGHILQVGTPADVYRRPTCKTVAHFIGETDFIAGQVHALEGGHIFVDTPIGRFEGVPGDRARLPAAGAVVTLSIRPECWRLGGESRPVNCVAGRIGEEVYLGEVAQYGFVPLAAGAGAGATAALKIYELNPRFLGSAGAGTALLQARVEVEDVVVLPD